MFIAVEDDGSKWVSLEDVEKIYSEIIRRTQEFTCDDPRHIVLSFLAADIRLMIDGKPNAVDIPGYDNPPQNHLDYLEHLKAGG